MDTFADGFYLLALFNPADAAHDAAVLAAEESFGKLVYRMAPYRSRRGAMQPKESRGLL